MIPECFGEYGLHRCGGCRYATLCMEASMEEEEDEAMEAFGLDMEDFLVGGKDSWM